MAYYKLTITRTSLYTTTGIIIFWINGEVRKSTTCWENPSNLIEAKKYTGCSATIMREKQFKSVYIPDSQTGKVGIFVHQGTKPGHSDGCIVCSLEFISFVYDNVPKNQSNITIEVKNGLPQPTNEW